MGNNFSNISIEQLVFMRDERYVWLCNTRIDHPYYNRVRDEYEAFNKTIIEYENADKERKNKILAAVISGVIGLAGITAATVISNSSLGAKFDNSMKGLSGRITGNHF